MAKRFGLGFVSTDTPIGGRYWFSQKVGLDVGFGISSNQVGTPKETFTDYQFSLGLPINLMSKGDRVNLNFLPMFTYSSVDLGTENDKYVDIRAALEFEVFVTKDLSLGASQGLLVTLYNPADPLADSHTDISLFGKNVTEFGVHYYLPGGEESSEGK
jgi:hypothetical protein